MLQSNVNTELGSLGVASSQELREVWEKLYRSPPPKGMSMKLMIRACAYQVQVKAWGGLKSSDRKALKAHGLGDGGERPVGDGNPLKGTRLVREYRGVSQVVDIVPGGYRWKNQTYASLSAVARAITGTKWNGLVFFGLKKRGG